MNGELGARTKRQPTRPGTQPALRRRWKKIAASVLLVLALGAGLAAAAPPTRPAKARGTTVVPDDFLRRWDPVTIFFDRDRGAAAGGPEDDPTRLVTLTPAHPGAYTWLDARTLQFKPAEPWPPLRRFTWAVKGGERVRLATLMAPPRATEPADGREGLDAVEAVTLTFPEPLDPADLAKAVTLELRPLPGIGDEDARWLNLDDFEIKVMERQTRSAPATYVLALHQPIPLGTRVLVHFRLSLDSTDESFSQVSFRTAEPFRAVGFGCRANRYPITPQGSRYTVDQAIRCRSDERAVVVDFSAEVDPAELDAILGRNLVRLSPSVANLTYEVAGKRLTVGGDFARETEYRVAIEPVTLHDRQRRPLDMHGASELYLYFPSEPAYLRWGAAEGLVERHGPQQFPVLGRGNEELDLRLHPVDPFDPSFWPFPEQPVVLDESLRPPGPGEEPEPWTSLGTLINPQQLARQISALGSPPVSTLVDLPLRREGGAARFGLDLAGYLAEVRGEGRPGTYLAGLRRLGKSTERAWVRVQVSDLALTTVEEPDRVVFAVTSLKTGRPIPGARVRVRTRQEKPCFEGTTGADGRLVWTVLPCKDQVRRIEVVSGDDVLTLDPRRAPDVYRDNHWAESRETWLQWTQYDHDRRGPGAVVLAHLFTERPVYRPEEPVHVKGYLRTREAGRLKPVTGDGFLVIDGPGDLEWRIPLTLGPRGSFYHLFDEEKLPTGSYTARFEPRHHPRPRSGTVTFRKEAYRLPRFEVQLHGPEHPTLDEAFEVELTATYYAGGQVSERPVRWRVTQFPYTWRPRARKGFYYSSDGRYSRTGRFESRPAIEKEDVTDENGAAKLLLNPALEPTAQPRIYVVEATVVGADDQTVTATQQLVALPPFLLGLKVPRYLERAEAIEPEVIVVGPGDELLEGQEVTVRLLHRQWHSHLRASDFSDGVARYVTDVVDEPVLEEKLSSGAEPVKLRLPIEEAGVYLVEIESRDRLGRIQVVAVDLYAGGEEPVGWAKPSTQVFEVATDKSEYRPGETANLVLKSPFQNAEVLAVVEAPEGNRYEWLPVRGGKAAYAVPVLGTYTPRLPVHFILMRGRLVGTRPLPGSSTDLGKPATMASTAWVRVKPVDNMVEVKLEHPGKALPGQTIEVSIDLRDPDGAPLAGEVTLWLVDQAVLALGKEQRLDPLPDFITPVKSHLEVHDTRGLAFGEMPFADEPGGGEGEEGKGVLDRQTVRRHFQPVPYFNPAIEVGDDGHARVEVELPDNLTNFKLRAKAITPERFGVAKGHLEVRLPVIVQPALPRFVRPGDRFLAGAIGRIVEGEGGPGRVEAQFEGVDLEGEASRELSWLPERPERLTFPVAVPTPPYDEDGRLSREEVLFRVAVERLSDGAGDAFEVRLPIRDDRDRVRLKALGELLPGKPFKLPDAEEPVRPGSLRRTVLVSDQPGLVGMASGLSFLLQYPYGCTEQRVSRARAQLALRAFRDVLHQEDDDAAIDRAVNDTLRWIGQVVQPNGLTAYWPGSQGYVSLTAWVVEFLVEARDGGYAVDEELFGTLKGSLAQALRSDYSHFIDGESWAERVWALQALSSAGAFDESYGAELSRKSQYLDLEGVAGVLLAFGRAQHGSLATGPLTAELWDGVVIRLHQGQEIYGGLQKRRTTRNGLILPSETRTLASLVRALGRYEGSDPRFQKLVDALVHLGRGDGWGTTNANAAALLALTDVLKPPFSGTAQQEVEVTLPGSGGRLRLAASSPTAYFVGTATGPGEVRRLGGGERPLVVRAETSYFPEADGSQVAPRRDGFVVERELLLQTTDPPQRIDLTEPGRTVELAVGDVVEEHVRVVNPADRFYVAVVIPLAAGVEPLNPNLATAPPEARASGQLTLQPTYVAFLDEKIAFYYNSLPKGTYDFYVRTRATVVGSFIQPPAKAEMMYDGSVAGGSAGARIVVERPGE